MRFLLLTFLAVLSWFAGLVIYLLALRIIYGQSISSGDLEAVVLWSAITSVIAIPLVYAPVMFVTRYLLNGVNPVAVFPLAGILVSVFPIILLGVLLGGLNLGGFFSALFSPESLLFNFLFAGTGAVFGLGFARIYRSEIPAKHSLERTGDSAREASEKRNSASQNDM